MNRSAPPTISVTGSVGNKSKREKKVSERQELALGLEAELKASTKI